MSYRLINYSVLALTTLAAPLFVEAMAFGTEVPRISFIIIVTAFVAVGVLLITLISSSLAHEDIKWKKPSLGEKLSGMQEPFQLFYLNALVFGALAFGSLITSMLTNFTNWTWVFPACISVGAYIGVLLSTFFLQDRIVTTLANK